MKTILILKNERERFRRYPYLIDPIAERWHRAGHRVVTHHGPERPPNADVVVLHVDRTVVPDSYRECLANHPVVLNRNVADISKSAFSSLIVTRHDDYDGPVIVKTNANFGGRPEARPGLAARFLRWLPLRRFRPEPQWETVGMLDPHHYPIFGSKQELPPGVWHNRKLLVERFLPEREGGLFYLRYWMFLGDQGWAGRFGAAEPIVKFSGMVTRDERVPVPEALAALRRRLGFDYGRFDYVEHHGRPLVFDVNKTMGGGRSVREYDAELDQLAKGMEGFLNR